VASTPVAGNLTADIDTAVVDICARAPQMREIVEAFAMLARERLRIGIDTEDWPGVKDFDAEAFAAGEPLLAGREFSGLLRGFIDAAEKLLPVIGRAFPHIALYASGLRSALAARPDLGLQILEAALTDDEQSLQPAAQAAGIPIGTFSFLVFEVLKSCLRLAVERLAHLADDNLWCKGRCPVCGAGPDFGLLKEKRDPSEFLVSKSGRLWLHCSLCGHVWRFVRLVCPSCGETDHEQLDVFTAVGRERERIHACRACLRYLLVIDLVDSREKLNPELTPLMLIPLDLLAREKGYLPLAKTPWGGFS